MVTKAPTFYLFRSYSKTITVASCQISHIWLTNLLVRNAKKNYTTISNRFVGHRIKTKTGSRAFSISDLALWNSACANANTETILTFRK